MIYPDWVFHKNENITRKNMREYERQQAELERKYEELNPHYHKLDLYQQALIRDFVRNDVTQITRYCMQKCGIKEMTEEALRNLRRE